MGFARQERLGVVAVVVAAVGRRRWQSGTGGQREEAAQRRMVRAWAGGREEDGLAWERDGEFVVSARQECRRGLR